MYDTRSSMVVASALAFAAVLAPSTALANPRALPFTYPYGTLGEGSYEVEQYVDLDPVQALSATTGAKTTYVASELQTEFEVGLTDHVELGLYATFVPEASGYFSETPVIPEGNGAKERIRGRFAEEGQLPIDVALYGELTENEREFEIEGKIILARRIGPVHLDVNLTSNRLRALLRRHEGDRRRSERWPHRAGRADLPPWSRILGARGVSDRRAANGLQPRAAPLSRPGDDVRLRSRLVDGGGLLPVERHRSRDGAGRRVRSALVPQCDWHRVLIGGGFNAAPLLLRARERTDERPRERD